ncbi:MAG: sulfite exporter TauE/SafE family protein [Candidatus Thiodiazotropha sp. (ex Rostrolucina anterorostrata)]|nr:sulfite exporter TauE/SafE family protein [Candidatus Thiodiazotropha sp. (ex Rostrolucina anterorostrata)]
MNPEITLSIAFMTGILGSFHCLGMCSGINGGYFIHAAQRPRLSLLFSFHGMRLATYTLLGTSGALLGPVLVQSGIVGKVQGLLMILAGVLIVLLGLNLIGALKWKRSDSKPTVSISSLSKTPALLQTLTAGLLNGLVPCSLVFSIAIKAAATADPIDAGLLMLSFGVGTLPSMVIVTLLSASIGCHLQGGLTKITGIFVVLLGMWTLYEGLIFYDVMRGLGNW